MKEETKLKLATGAATVGFSYLAEFGFFKVVGAVLDSVLPAGTSKISKFAIKAGLGLIYESTIGEKVTSYVSSGITAGLKLGTQLASGSDEETELSEEE